MARIIVTADDGQHLLEEDVHPVHLESEASAIQILDRIEWAIYDAERRLRAARKTKKQRRKVRPRRGYLGDVGP